MDKPDSEPEFLSPEASTDGSKPGFPSATPSPEGREGTVPVPPGISADERLASYRDAAAQGRNVLLLVSGDLLRALAEVPHELNVQQAQAWHDLLRAELNFFTSLCDRLNVRRDHLLAARYVLCTALDEAASLSRWNAKGPTADIWAGMALLPEFHGEREGGEVVFMLLGRMANAPQEHMPVLELIHHVLSLGFMGHYGTQTDGHRQMGSIRHRLFSMVSAAQPPVPRELSGRWRGAGVGKFRLLRAVPVWASASVLGLVLLAQFGWSKYQLLSTATELEKRIFALKQLQPDQPVAPQSALGLTQLLASDIEQGRVTVTEQGGVTQVVFKGDGMFASGQSTLSGPASEVVQKVGQALMAVPGQVVVTGHTDNLPPGDPLELNKALSLGRATAVAQSLQAQGVTPQRMQVLGKGDQVPVAGNDSAAGRAQNRRVVIEVRSDAPSAAVK